MFTSAVATETVLPLFRSVREVFENEQGFKDHFRGGGHQRNVGVRKEREREFCSRYRRLRGSETEQLDKLRANVSEEEGGEVTGEHQKDKEKFCS